MAQDNVISSFLACVVEKIAASSLVFGIHCRASRKGVGLSLGQVFRDVANVIHEGEIAVFALVGWGLVPITRNFYEVYANATSRGIAAELDDEGAEADVDESTTESKSFLRETYEVLTPWDDDRVNDRIHEMMPRRQKSPPNSETDARGMIPPFRRTRLFHAVDHISQASKIGLSIIAVDCASLVARKFGYNPWGIMERLSRIYSKVVYTGWIAYRFKLLKRYFLDVLFPGDLGKLLVFDQLADGLLYLCWAFSTLNYLEVQTGVALKVMSHREFDY
jgi:hypothetical protein